MDIIHITNREPYCTGELIEAIVIDFSLKSLMKKFHKTNYNDRFRYIDLDGNHMSFGFMDIEDLDFRVIGTSLLTYPQVIMATTLGG